MAIYGLYLAAEDSWSSLFFPFLPTLCCASNHGALRPQKPYDLLWTEKEGGGMVGYLWIARPCVPTRKDWRDRQPTPEQQCQGGGEVRSWLLFQQLCGIRSQRQCPRRNCWGTTQRQDNPPSYESPAPPPCSWSLLGSVIQLREPSSTSLLLISPGLCHPAKKAQLHLPSLDLSWALSSS